MLVSFDLTLFVVFEFEYLKSKEIIFEFGCRRVKRY